MLRQAHNISLRETAKLAGTSASHLSRVESGQRAASTELTTRLVNVIADLPTKDAA